MNNNRILQNWLREHSDEALSDHAGINRADIRSADQADLRKMVNEMGGDPDEVISLHNENDDAQKKLDAMRDLLGGGSIDPDQVKDIVDKAINSDVKPVMDDLNEKVDQLAPLADTLDRIADSMAGKTSNRLPIATAIASGKNPILEVIAPFYVAGSDNPTKVCVSAPPSYGKSYSVALLGESYDTFITHGCSGDLDEWSMLLGGCTPRKEGGFITVDGKLVEAVRSASEGKNTLFFLDEVFRMSPTTMESMLAFLAPQRDSAGVLTYELTTKQNDAGVLETIRCNAEKLHIICATNLCEITPPEAFMDRFLFKHVRYEEAKVANISESCADKYSISDSELLGKVFAKAMGASRKMFGEGQLKKPLSIRDLERACIHAEDATAESVRDWLVNNGTEGMLMWNSETGDIIKDSEIGVADLIKIMFTLKTKAEDADNEAK